MKPRYTDAFWGKHPFDEEIILYKNKNKNSAVPSQSYLSSILTVLKPGLYTAVIYNNYFTQIEITVVVNVLPQNDACEDLW